eukprot:m.145871 g.145871  ORF g.145871 m.145871 type:complete len:101 (+) comp30457_c1_seq7:1031-1333(+)
MVFGHVRRTYIRSHTSVVCQLGEFRLPNSGLTYKNDTSFTISAYRVHERDPVVFQRGLRFVWRNSDELPTPLDGLGETTSTPPSWRVNQSSEPQRNPPCL